MPQPSTPTYGEMMQPTLDALHALGGQATNDAIYDLVTRTLQLPPETIRQLHKPGSSLTEVEYRLQWTRTYLRQFGLIESPQRGHWVLAELGRRTFHLNPKEIIRTVQANMTARRSGGEADAL